MAISSDVNTFLQNFSGGGARANRFQVTITASPVDIPQSFTFLCRSSHIPGQTIGTVDVPYMGLVAKVPGDRTFDDWNVTVYNDTAWDIRAAFEQWVNLLMRNQANVAVNMVLEANSVYADAIVQQLDRMGNPIFGASYNMMNIFPHTVSPIDLAYDNNNTVETFDVTFAINWWQSARVF
jgi:hypothetical protein